MSPDPGTLSPSHSPFSSPPLQEICSLFLLSVHAARCVWTRLKKPGSQGARHNNSICIHREVQVDMYLMCSWKQRRKHFILIGGHATHSVLWMAHSYLELRIWAQLILTLFLRRLHTHFQRQSKRFEPHSLCKTVFRSYHASCFKNAILVVLKIKPRAQHTLGKHSTTKSNPEPPMWVLKLNTEAVTLFKKGSFLFPQPTPTSLDSECSDSTIWEQWQGDHLCQWRNSARAETTLISHEPFLYWHVT